MNLAAFVFSWGLLASSRELVYPTYQCSCQKTQGDKFEEPLAFNFGPFKGSCIDSCRFRPAQILKSRRYGSISLSKNPKEFFVAQVLHNEEYRVARLRLDHFSDVEAGFEEFTPGVFHTFLKFKLREDAPSILLLSQRRESDLVLYTRGLVISSEGVPPRDKPYNLIDGALGRYLLVHRILTPEESKRWIQLQKNPVIFLKVNIDPKKVPRILGDALTISQLEKFDFNYDLFSNNCATSMLRILEPATPKKVKSIWPDWIKGLSIAGPFGTLGYMQENGILIKQ